MKPVVLMLMPLAEPYLGMLRYRFELVFAPGPAERRDAVATDGHRIDAVLTNGTLGLTADEIAAMPRLALAAAFGAGYENIALDAARRRGIVVVNGAGTNDDCVADHALALLLASVRHIPALDAHARAGGWRDGLPLRPQLAGRRLGVLGLGTIGRKIARRGEAFDLAVGYHNRSARDDVPYRYFPTVAALAAWCDLLVVATPGGPASRHLVDAAVLRALGPGGTLVNIARGSVVDTDALAAALATGTIAGAGLDVYEGEPQAPAALVGLANVVLTPHVAGSSPEAMQASIDRFVENMALHFAGRPVRTPV